MRVSVIGLGKLGSPLAAVLASKGHQVIGVDLNQEYVNLLAGGKAPVQEPQLQHLVDISRERLRATTDYDTAVLGSDITFVIVPTPSDSKGSFSNKYVIAAATEIGKALRKKRGYHVVSITSTVMPGSTGGEIREALETSSGRSVGKDVGLCYNPEFIALGSVVHDMLLPDMILIGESDPRAGDALEAIYRTSCDNNPPVQRMNFVNAELTKISVNTFVTTKISYANMLADICDRLPGADVDVVTNALGMDSRIGRKYLKGALGYGGPCFPRDNVAFSHLARSIGAKPDVAEATDQINLYQVDRLASLVGKYATSGCRVGILGLSYKPDTGVIEESQGVMLAAALADQGYAVSIFDPLALPAANAVLGEKATATPSAEALVAGVDVLVLATAWPHFRSIPAANFARRNGRLVVIDCWRVLSREEIGAIADLVYLGYGDKPSPSVESLLQANSM
jgi:UDPglucose 6-dehydrogenase